MSERELIERGDSISVPAPDDPDLTLPPIYEGDPEDAFMTLTPAIYKATHEIFRHDTVNGWVPHLRDVLLVVTGEESFAVTTGVELPVGYIIEWSE